MSDQHHALVRRKGIGQADQIGSDRLQAIGSHSLWLIRAAIAAHVDRTGGVARCRHWPKLVPPGIPAFRETMDHDCQRRSARFRPFDRTAQRYITAIDHPEFRHQRSSIENAPDLAGRGGFCPV